MGTTRPELSQELWGQIFDLLQDEPKSLLACAFVCKAWYPWCYHLIFQRRRIYVDLKTREDVFLFAKYARASSFFVKPVLMVAVLCSTGDRVSHLRTFGAMLGGKLPRLTALCLRGVPRPLPPPDGRLDDSMDKWAESKTRVEWTTGSVHPDAFLHLATFTSVTALNLANITFPTARIFMRLICAFPNLARLNCSDVAIRDGGGIAHLFMLPSHGKHLARLTIQMGHDSKAENAILCVLNTVMASRRITRLSLLRSWAHGSVFQPLLDDAVCLESLHIAYTSEAPQPVGYAGRETTPSLARNVNLKILHFTIWMYPPYDQDISWLFSILLSVSSDSLRELTIEFPTVQHISDINPKLTYVRLRCGILDGILSLPRFSALQQVNIELFKSLGDMDISERDIAAQLPMLLERGILRIRSLADSDVDSDVESISFSE